MKKYLGIILCFVFVLTMAVAILPMAYSQEEAEKAKAISGEVVSVDLEKSAIVIKQVSGENATETTVAIDDSTAIKKGEEDITIADLAAGDKVAVECAVNEAGSEVATSVVVETAAN